MPASGLLRAFLKADRHDLERIWKVVEQSPGRFAKALRTRLAGAGALRSRDGEFLLEIALLLPSHVRGELAGWLVLEHGRHVSQEVFERLVAAMRSDGPPERFLAAWRALGPASARARRLLEWRMRVDPATSVQALNELLDSRHYDMQETAIELLQRRPEHAWRGPLLRALHIAKGRPDRGLGSPATRLQGRLAQLRGSRWSPKQLTGEPDTLLPGSQPSAWAPLGEQPHTQLIVEYRQPVLARALRVHETRAPGAIVRIDATTVDGEVYELWSGRARTHRSRRWFEPRIRYPPREVGRITLQIAPRRGAGRPEIDAVELIGGGIRQWAQGAFEVAPPKKPLAPLDDLR